MLFVFVMPVLAAGTATTTPVTLNANTLPFSPEQLMQMEQVELGIQQ